MSSSLLAMGVFTLVGAITPGPVNVLALRHGAARSRLVSAAVLGACATVAAVAVGLWSHQDLRQSGERQLAVLNNQLQATQAALQAAP